MADYLKAQQLNLVEIKCTENYNQSNTQSNNFPTLNCLCLYAYAIALF